MDTETKTEKHEVEDQKMLYAPDFKLPEENKEVENVSDKFPKCMSVRMNREYN